MFHAASPCLSALRPSPASFHCYFLASPLCLCVTPSTFPHHRFCLLCQPSAPEIFFQMFFSVSLFGSLVLPHTCTSSLPFYFPHSPSRFYSAWLLCLYRFLKIFSLLFSIQIHLKYCRKNCSCKISSRLLLEWLLSLHFQCRVKPEPKG